MDRTSSFVFNYEIKHMGGVGLIEGRDMVPLIGNVQRLKQRRRLHQNARYQLEFKVRFVAGFSGDRETFWQIHAYHAACHARPPLMLKFSNGHLVLEDGIKMSQIRGRWNTLKLVFQTSKHPTYSLYFNGRKIVSNRKYAMAACGIPYFKFGIYRPGNRAGNNLSVVDFDSIQLTLLQENFKP